MTGFEPSIYFHRKLRGVCGMALGSLRCDLQFAENASGSIKAELVALFDRLEEGSNAIDLRRECLFRTAHHWALIKSIRTCFFCLFESSEHVLGCGHAICD